MRFVPVKSEEQQASGDVFRARDLPVRRRTQCINALRGHWSEYGDVFPQGSTHADAVIAHIEDLNSCVPAPESFRAGRDFAAWLGLVPLQRSTGGKQRLGATSKMGEAASRFRRRSCWNGCGGERATRRLLILGASPVLRWASQRGTPADP